MVFEVRPEPGVVNLSWTRFDTPYLRRQSKFFKSELVLKESLWFYFSQFYGKKILFLLIILDFS